MIVLGVIFVLIVIFSILTPTTFKDMADSLKVFFARSNDFPLSFESGMIIEEKQMKNAEIMISKGSLVTISDNGGLLFRDSFNMSDPYLIAGDTRAAVFDRGNKEARIYNRTTLMEKLTFEYPIIDADMSTNGTFAVITESDEYTAQMECYSKASYAKTMTWYCAYNFPYAVFLNDGGSRASVCAAGMDSDGMFTSVYCIDTNKADELFSVRVDGLVVSLKYYSNYGIILFTEDAAYKVTSKGEIQKKVELDGIPFVGLVDRDSSLYAVGFGSNNIPDINTVKIYDQNLDVLGEMVDVGYINDMYLRRNRLYILGDGTVSLYDISGSPGNRYSVPSNARFLEVFQNDIWIIQSGMIDKVDTSERMEEQ